MLRITLELVPSGIEDAKRTIGTLTIGNLGPYRGKHRYSYVLAHIRDGNPAATNGTVLHRREEGAWRLVERVLRKALR